MTSNNIWRPEDPRSRALLSLAAGHGLPSDVRVEGGLIELTRRHGLTSILAKESKSPAVTAIHARQLARQTVMEKHMARILGRLAESGVQTAVLKGPAVARYYSNSALRSYSDLDFLVGERDLDVALEVLRADDFVTEIPPKGPKAAKRDVVVVDPTGVRFNLDLHWDLFSYSQLRGRASGAIAEGWGEATLDDSGMGPYWVLPQAYEVSFLATHAVLDHRFRLILFRDLLELVNHSEVDWVGLVDVARRWRLRATTYLALWIARGALDVDVPQDFLDEVRPGSIPLSYLERSIPQVDLVRFDGHTAHPVNLASVLLADTRADRVALAMRAPSAFPKWKRRVAEEHDDVGEHMPRTLIVVSSNRRRGAEVFTERLRDGLTARGWVVDAVALRGSEGDSRADVGYLVSEEDSTGGRFEWPVLRTLRRKIRGHRPDLIIANGGATLRYSLAATFGLGTDVAYVSIGEPDYWIRSTASRMLNRMMLRRVDKILAVSEATRRQLIALEPTTADKVVVTYTGLTGDLFEVQHSDYEGPLRVVMLGSLTSEKEPSLALDAVAGLDDALLRFVGDGPLRTDLEKSVRKRGLENRVEFVGSVDDVKPHLGWAHVLLLTSKTEGLPGAILEGSAAGLAIVAVDVGGVGEAVQDGETGFVTGRDRQEIEDALAKLDADRSLLKEMGSSGREVVKTRFLLDDVIENYRRTLVDMGR